LAITRIVRLLILHNSLLTKILVAELVAQGPYAIEALDGAEVPYVPAGAAPPESMKSLIVPDILGYHKDRQTTLIVQLPTHREMDVCVLFKAGPKYPIYFPERLVTVRGPHGRWGSEM
jgi:hypothetical protein